LAHESAHPARGTPLRKASQARRPVWQDWTAVLALVPALAFSIIGWILALHGWVLLAVVFAFPALEASAFVGFVFPGEIAVLLGGVAASRGTVPLWAVIAAAVCGAIIGDSAGYFIGRRWGTQLLHGTVGRLPVISTHLDKHLESAQA